MLEPPVRVPSSFASTSLSRRMVRGVAASFILTALSYGFLFLGQLLIARVLSRSEYAQYTVSISFVALFALFADLGMNPLFTTLFARAREHAVDGLRDERGTILGSAIA